MTGIVNPYQVGVPLPGFNVDAVTFDGTNDYMTRGAGLTGSADGTTLIVSAWLNTASTPSFSRVFSSVLQAVEITINASGQFEVYVSNAAFTAEIQFRGSTNLQDGAWHNILVAVNTGFAPASRIRQIYVDDVAETVTTISNTGAGSFNMDFTQTNWAFGAMTNGSFKLAADAAEFFYAPLQFLDFTVESNRRKFITAAGKPEDVGSDGSTPTGVAPRVYFSVPDGGAAADFATNRGTGGNFTITGSLTIAPTSPSD